MGIETIDGAVSNPSVRLVTQGAMTEAAAMLSKKYGVPFIDIFNHAEDLLLRFGNKKLGDTCERVARDPMRKLKAGDRLAGALAQCFEHGVYPAYVAAGYASALDSVTREKQKAREIATGIGGLEGEALELVMELFDGFDHESIIPRVEAAKKRFRGDMV